MSLNELIAQIQAERDRLQDQVAALDNALAALNGGEPEPQPALQEKPAALPQKKEKAAQRKKPEGTSKGTLAQPKKDSLRWAAVSLIREHNTITSNKLVELLKPHFPDAYKDSVNASLGYELRYPFDVDKRRTEPWLWTWNQDKCNRYCAGWDWPPLEGHCPKCRHPIGAHDGSGKCVRSGCGCIGDGQNRQDAG